MIELLRCKDDPRVIFLTWIFFAGDESLAKGKVQDHPKMTLG